MAAQKNSSVQQLELGKDVFSHPLSSTFFLEKVMFDALEEHDGKVSIGGLLPICGLLMTLMLLLKKGRN